MELRKRSASPSSATRATSDSQACAILASGWRETEASSLWCVVLSNDGRMKGVVCGADDGADRFRLLCAAQVFLDADDALGFGYLQAAMRVMHASDVDVVTADQAIVSVHRSDLQRIRHASRCVRATAQPAAPCGLRGLSPRAL